MSDIFTMLMFMNETRSTQEELTLTAFGDWLRQLRKARDFTQEEFAAAAGFSRSYYTEIETGKRNVSLLNLVKIADVLNINLPELVAFHTPTKVNPRPLASERFRSPQILIPSGLTVEIIQTSIQYTYELIDAIDMTLISGGSPRIAQMLELANLSAILGNLLGAGIEKASGGLFIRNTPHQYPDLLAQGEEATDIEIKIALEHNKPKGHLAKSGYYLTYRYVLADENGIYTRGKANRGAIPHIWEVRFGWLEEEHFNLSNTAGDSGKTAVINAMGMDALKVIYCDLARCPYAPHSRSYQAYAKLYR